MTPRSTRTRAGSARCRAMPSPTPCPSSPPTASAWKENDGAAQRFYGHSFIADHAGELVESFGDEDEGVLVHDLRSRRNRALPRRVGLLPRPPPGPLRQKHPKARATFAGSTVRRRAGVYITTFYAYDPTTSDTASTTSPSSSGVAKAPVPSRALTQPRRFVAWQGEARLRQIPRIIPSSIRNVTISMPIGLGHPCLFFEAQRPVNLVHLAVLVGGGRSSRYFSWTCRGSRRRSRTSQSASPSPREISGTRRGKRGPRGAAREISSFGIEIRR